MLNFCPANGASWKMSEQFKFGVFILLGFIFAGRTLFTIGMGRVSSEYKVMSDFMPFYKCNECGEEVDAKDITASGFPQKFYCPNCVHDFVEADK